MDLRARVDDALCHDGSGRLVDLAQRGLEKTIARIGVVCCSVDTQYELDTNFLRPASIGLGIGGDRMSMAATCSDNLCVWPHSKIGRLAAGAVFLLGILCHRTELCDLAT